MARTRGGSPVIVRVRLLPATEERVIEVTQAQVEQLIEDAVSDYYFEERPEDGEDVVVEFVKEDK